MLSVYRPCCPVKRLYVCIGSKVYRYMLGCVHVCEGRGQQCLLVSRLGVGECQPLGQFHHGLALLLKSAT